MRKLNTFSAMCWLQAYKNYVKTLLKRKNTITGVIYSEDPTVFAWELANEPETSANYEINRGIKPGSLVYNWLDEMSAYVKGLAPKHMVSIPQTGCCCYRPLSWDWYRLSYWRYSIQWVSTRLFRLFSIAAFPCTPYIHTY